MKNVTLITHCQSLILNRLLGWCNIFATRCKNSVSAQQTGYNQPDLEENNNKNAKAYNNELKGNI